MYHDRQDLTALIGSRICHDLISPLGAISNGLELLAMAGGPHSPELDLITESIANANSKIRFFRVAYGATPDGATLAKGEILSILADYFHNSRVTAEWHVETEAPRRDIKLVFLAIQCMESAMPYGGAIGVRFVDDVWHLTAESEKLRVISDHWTLLEGQRPSQDLSAAAVQFGMLAMLVRWRKPALSLNLTQTNILIQL